jgi:hypothetical protein
MRISMKLTFLQTRTSVAKQLVLHVMTSLEPCFLTLSSYTRSASPHPSNDVTNFIPLRRYPDAFRSLYGTRVTGNLYLYLLYV